MTRPPAPDLTALLDDPPEGVAIRRGMDAVEIQALKPLWTRDPEQPLAPGAAAPGRAWLAVSLLAALITVLLCLTQPDAGVLLAYSLTVALLIVGIPLAFLALAGISLRWLQPPVRITLTAQRVEIRGAVQSHTFDLETIESLAVRAPRDWRLRGLEIQTRQQRYDLLSELPTAHLRWLAEVLEAAVQQRKAALLAAGHDEAALAQPPPEVAALRAFTRQGGFYES